MTIIFNIIIVFVIVILMAFIVFLLDVLNRYNNKLSELMSNQQDSHSCNPLCPDDLLECDRFDSQNVSSCHDCERNHNGVRATGAMPNLEIAYNWVHKLFKHLQSSKTTKNVKTS